MATLPQVPTGARVSPAETTLASVRAAQRGWAQTPVRTRLRLLRCFRAELATGARELAATVAKSFPGSLRRTDADTLVAEVLPLAEACRFLEKEAEFVLRTRREDSSNRPFWLRGVDVEVERAPLGVVLLIGPGNYPLFLPGVQALQALAAGNAVLWKPAPAGVACAHALRVMLIASGLAPELLTILDPAPAQAAAAIEAGVDKVFLTGSAATGEIVMHALAGSATPSVMELSGCDAVFVLEGADPKRVVDALLFGLRLNGSATCMAPRRVIVAQSIAARGFGGACACAGVGADSKAFERVPGRCAAARCAGAARRQRCPDARSRGDAGKPDAARRGHPLHEDRANRSVRAGSFAACFYYAA